MQAWKQAFPDVKGTVDHAFADGNTVVLEVTWTGTQTGPLQGPGGAIPATGRQQTTRTSWVLTFDGDRIKNSRHYFDMLSMLQQLAVLPAPAPATA
jgi:predicted ester cyclase